MSGLYFQIDARRLHSLTRGLLALLTPLLLILLPLQYAQAFCGFYVGKADAGLFNEASQVIMVRDGNRTVISMLNDYRGDLKEFALVVPVPEVLARGQIHLGDKKIFDRIADYSAPRLAEYFDDNPCARRRYEVMDRAMPMAAPAPAPMVAQKALGVVVEATYSVGEYDIVILSATQSDGLETWLTQNGYRVPAGASRALKPYIMQNMKFFVAKVNLKEQAKLAATSGFTSLRPLQFAFESPKFMLPIRLGMVNAKGPQDLIVFALTRNGRVESSNYRTIKLPANMDIPLFVRQDFKSFYRSLFDNQAKKEDYRAVFTEYFWNMNWCDPCSAQPLTPDEQRAAGVFWLDDLANRANPNYNPNTSPIYLTRLHIRYTRETFPEDLSFTETKDQENFQTRYVLRNPWKGSPSDCPEAKTYYDELGQRQQHDAQTLASITGWDMNDIRKRMDINPPPKTWWGKLWGDSGTQN